MRCPGDIVIGSNPDLDDPFDIPVFAIDVSIMVENPFDVPTPA